MTACMAAWRARSTQPGVYAVLDLEALGARQLDPIEVAEAMLEAGVAALQLRAKSLAIRPLVQLATTLAERTSARGIPFFVNDRLDVALAVGAGVHLGQSDFPLQRALGLAAGLPVGVSTHDAAQLHEALAAGPAYVAFGPVFATASKRDAEPVVGLHGLARAAAHARPTPLVAIGGITLERAPEVVRAGATLVAAIAGLLPEPGRESGRISAVCERVSAYNRAVRTSCSSPS